MTETFVIFEVNGTRYAVRSGEVQRVEMVETVTRVPNGPEFIEGVVSVRGQVLPVISLRKRFGLPPIPYGQRTRLVIIRLDGRSIGLLADSAHEFLRVDEDQVKPLPDDLNGPEMEYLDGVVMRNERVMLIVNLAQLINPQERKVIAAPVAGEHGEEKEP